MDTQRKAGQGEGIGEGEGGQGAVGGAEREKGAGGGAWKKLPDAAGPFRPVPFWADCVTSSACRVGGTGFWSSSTVGCSQVPQILWA